MMLRKLLRNWTVKKRMIRICKSNITNQQAKEQYSLKTKLINKTFSSTEGLNSQDLINRCKIISIINNIQIRIINNNKWINFYRNKLIIQLYFHLLWKTWFSQSKWDLKSNKKMKWKEESLSNSSTLRDKTSEAIQRMKKVKIRKVSNSHTKNKKSNLKRKNIINSKILNTSRQFTKTILRIIKIIIIIIKLNNQCTVEFQIILIRPSIILRMNKCKLICLIL